MSGRIGRTLSVTLRRGFVASLAAGMLFPGTAAAPAAAAQQEATESLEGDVEAHPDSGLSPIRTLARHGDPDEPQVAVDPRGNAVFAWQRLVGTTLQIRARARSGAGALSAIQAISPDGRDAKSPRVAIDRNGNAIFAWLRHDGTTWRVQARARSAAGVLSPVQTLSPAGNTFFPQVAVDSSGNAVFAWERSNETGTSIRVETRARTVAGALSAVQTVSVIGEYSTDPQVAVAPGGAAVFTWTTRDDKSDQGEIWKVRARVRSAAGALSAIQTLSPVGGGAADSRVAVDSNGNAIFTWEQTFDGVTTRILGRRRSAAGSLSAVQTLSSAGHDARVAVDPDGNAIVIWAFGFPERIQARARSAAGRLSAVQTLSPASSPAYSPEIGVDPAGQAIVTWRNATNRQVQARARSAAGALSAVEDISSDGQNAHYPQVAIDADGNAVFTWMTVEGTDSMIHTRIRFPK